MTTGTNSSNRVGTSSDRAAIVPEDVDAGVAEASITEAEEAEASEDVAAEADAAEDAEEDVAGDVGRHSDPTMTT